MQTQCKHAYFSLTYIGTHKNQHKNTIICTCMQTFFRATSLYRDLHIPLFVNIRFPQTNTYTNVNMPCMYTHFNTCT